jgi:hypothetical protein
MGLHNFGEGRTFRPCVPESLKAMKLCPFLIKDKAHGIQHVI